MAAVAGRVYPAVQFEIEPERVAEFARSIGADATDGVPPTFAAVYSLGVTVPHLFMDDEAAVDFSHLLHAEQEFEFQRHPRGGETVTSRGRVASDTSRRGMRFVSFETDTTAADGSSICKSRALFVVRS